MDVITTEVYETLPRGKGTSPGAYIIEHEQSKRLYVGSSENLGQRRRLHESTLRHGKNRNEGLQQAFNEDPKLTFTFVLTETKEAAVELEQKLLDRYMPQGVLFNKAPDAKAAGKGLIRSEETRQRIGQAGLGREPFNKGVPLTDHHREAHAVAMAQRKKPVVIEGTPYPSVGEAAQALGLNPVCVTKRLHSTSDRFQNWSFGTPL